MKVVLFSLHKNLGVLIIRQDIRNQRDGYDIWFVRRHIGSCYYPDYDKCDNMLYLKGADYSKDTRTLHMEQCSCADVFQNLLFSTREEVVCLERLSL